MSQADERLISPKAGGNVVDDAPLGGGKRWVVARPGGAGSADLLLARAASKEQLARVAGNRWDQVEPGSPQDSSSSA
jgi:hypothetical protein